MALPNTGSISLSDIQTEFGGSNPISLSEYYGVATGVPSSGSISFSDFYGKSNFDPTPNAVNWADIVAFNTAWTVGNQQTISGISNTITLNITVDDGVEHTHNRVAIRFNNGVSITDFGTNSNFTAVVSPNANTQFSAQIFNPAGGGSYANVTVRNQTDSNTILDTFTISLL